METLGKVAVIAILAFIGYEIYKKITNKPATNVLPDLPSQNTAMLQPNKQPAVAQQRAAAIVTAPIPKPVILTPAMMSSAPAYQLINNKIPSF